jgi:hypothetical protein
MMVLRRRGVHTQLRVNLKPTEECDMCQVLSRDDGAPLGCVLRPPNGGEATYAYTITGALRRAVGTEEGAPGAADSGGRTPFRPDTPRVPTRPCSPTA